MANAAFADLRVIGDMPPLQAAAKIREIGDDRLASAMEAAYTSAVNPDGHDPGTAGWLFRARLWQHTAHVFGYLEPAVPGPAKLPIRPAGNIAPDLSLKHSRVKISLNRLRISDYPGRGMHRILFDFYAQDQLAERTTELHFSSAFRAQEGEEAAVVGYPIFIGLNVGNEGLSFRCFTVNVQNSADEAFLNFLESDVAKAGLKLTTFAQPALEPLVKLVMGMTKIVAQRHQNVPVQDIYLGLDFGENAMGARLAVGDYIAVQIPENFTSIWDWNDWVYDPGNGHIVSKADPDKLIPYNYIVFGVSRYEGE